MLQHLDLALLLLDAGSVLLTFFFVPPTFLQGLVHVFVSRVVECEETQCSEEMFWVMMVNVCACGPGQQHFPGWQELVRQPDVVHSIHRETFSPSALKVELDWC